MSERSVDNQPLITTVIPTYQRPQLLRRAVLSVLNQTYSNLKVCIYDNASGDSTEAIVAELIRQDPRVHYYCHSHNIGSFHNGNFGMKRVDTPYFSLLSDDDILLPDFYEKAIQGFNKYPDAMFSATQTIIVKDKKVVGISWVDYEEKLYYPPEGLLKVAEGRTNTWTSTLYRKEVIAMVGLDESLAEGPAEQDFLLRVATVFPYVVSRSPGAIFVAHGLSVSASRREVDAVAEYMQMLNRIKNDAKVPVDIREAVYKKAKIVTVNSLWLGGWTDIKNRNFSGAQQVARSLRNDFSESFKSVVLSWAARLCEYSRLFYYLYIGSNQIRKFIHLTKRVRERHLQAQYGPYLQYLDRYSEA